MRVSARLAAIALVALVPASALALPIGFNRNQGDLEFSEASTRDFIVYFDRESPAEGRFTVQALEAARPLLERWIGIRRDKALPVILSSVTEGASFANFITDALEIQSMGQGDRALVWHEYTHALMYRHLDNIFGPAGAILHLPWMPVWFIEGLAEATSVSVGSDFQASVERYQALTGEWPSYDRMHSLYGSGFSSRGYAVSGAFVTWLVRDQGASRLPQILERFREKSMPWWWPWAAVPFNGFMPMDDSLGKAGRDLFERYKVDATERHRRDEGAKSRPLAASARGQGAGYLPAGQALTGTMMRKGIFDAKTGWMTGVSSVDAGSPDDGVTPDGRLSSNMADRDLHAWRHLRVGPDLAWMEQRKGMTRFCRVPSGVVDAGKITCPVEARFPQSIEWLGWDPAAKRVYLNRRTHSLLRDRHEILVWEPGWMTPQNSRMDLAAAGTMSPLSVARNGDDLVVVAAGRTHRSLLFFSPADGSCRGAHRMVDLPLALESLPVESSQGASRTRLGGESGVSAVLALWSPSGTVARKSLPGQLRRDFPVRPCDPQPGPTSPLLEAVRATARDRAKSGTAIEFDEALRLAAITDSPASSTTAKSQEDVKDASPDVIDVRDARWRGRSVLAFPWIGADDALGPQFGFVSVPLMDHLQNETVRLSFLVGAQSRYPNTDVRLISTRWRPSLSAAVFRQQTYNGVVVISPEGDLELSYLDETGARFEADLGFRAGSTSLSLVGGIKRSVMSPYLGPVDIRSGWLTELSATLAATTPLAGGRHYISESLFARVSPEGLDSDFDYNALGGQVNLAIDPRLWNSRLGLGFEGSRTRGKKMRELKEVYRPLKTFVPGSGGGYNQNSFGIAGDGWLFAGRYGDTQGRVKADWTVPLVEDFEKLLWIFYVDRLDFSAFLNYGGAWNSQGQGASPPAHRLFGAHGYNVDLQLDNKGVRFNVGAGVGQVFEKPWEAYLTAGFDALF